MALQKQIVDLCRLSIRCPGGVYGFQYLVSFCSTDVGIEFFKSVVDRAAALCRVAFACHGSIRVGRHVGPQPYADRAGQMWLIKLV
jgi:hypothetical protein